MLDQCRDRSRHLQHTQSARRPPRRLPASFERSRLAPSGTSSKQSHRFVILILLVTHSLKIDVGCLDSLPDLTKMSPTEFEHFVRQLCEASGLDGWTTQRSGDDGVDAVVINRDPLVGGLTIVQAKRYLAVIGISHIRELVGAMDEKGAGRGILVTTSWSRRDAGSKPSRTIGSS